MRTMLCVALLTVSAICLADNVPEYRSSYAGEESRRIKSLSEDDIRQLEQGRGWGLARAAELNGMPGPVHVLQMKQQISLTAVQEQKIRRLYNSMKADAVPLGKKLVQLEKQLDDAFADRSIDSHSLKSLLEDIARTRSRLRYVHLAAHLQTPAILSASQVTLYNSLRGYDHKDPCNQLPQGHDPVMWRKHNGCH